MDFLMQIALPACGMTAAAVSPDAAMAILRLVIQEITPDAFVAAMAAIDSDLRPAAEAFTAQCFGRGV